MTKQNVSASNVLERTPVAQQASANVSGAYGAGIAVVFIRETEAYAKKVADVEVKGERTMKDRLRDLIPLSLDDHIGFRNGLQQRVDAIGKEADDFKLSVSDYRKSNKVANVVYVTLSMWKKLSSAIAAGWKPDFDKPWSEISQSATAANDAQAARQAQAKVAEEIAKVEADVKLAPEVKAAKVTILKAQMAETPVRNKGGRPPVVKTLIDKLAELVKDQPLQEVEAAFVWFSAYLSDLSKSSARLVNTEMKKHGEADTGTLKPTGRVIASPPASIASEKAMAQTKSHTAKPKAKGRK